MHEGIHRGWSLVRWAHTMRRQRRAGEGQVPPEVPTSLVGHTGVTQQSSAFPRQSKRTSQTRGAGAVGPPATSAGSQDCQWKLGQVTTTPRRHPGLLGCTFPASSTAPNALGGTILAMDAFRILPPKSTTPQSLLNDTLPHDGGTSSHHKCPVLPCGAINA